MVIYLTEGKGYCARRQERQEMKKMQDFIENKESILVIPDVAKSKISKKSIGKSS